MQEGKYRWYEKITTLTQGRPQWMSSVASEWRCKSSLMCSRSRLAIQPANIYNQNLAGSFDFCQFLPISVDFCRFLPVPAKFSRLDFSLQFQPAGIWPPNSSRLEIWRQTSASWKVQLYVLRLQCYPAVFLPTNRYSRKSSNPVIPAVFSRFLWIPAGWNADWAGLGDGRPGQGVCSSPVFWPFTAIMLHHTNCYEWNTR